MNSTAWKSFERRVAKYVGGTRVGGMGDNELRKSFDVYTSDTIFECKLRAKFPTDAEVLHWLVEVAKRATGKFDKYALCIQHKNQRGFWFVENTTDGIRWYKSTMRNPFNKED